MPGVSRVLPIRSNFFEISKNVPSLFSGGDEAGRINKRLAKTRPPIGAEIQKIQRHVMSDVNALPTRRTHDRSQVEYSPHEPLIIWPFTEWYQIPDVCLCANGSPNCTDTGDRSTYKGIGGKSGGANDSADLEDDHIHYESPLC